MSVDEINRALEEYAEPERAQLHQRFFKTGEGEYGEGDIFMGVRMPFVRRVANLYRKADLALCGELLDSGIHEHRHVALIIMMEKVMKKDLEPHDEIYDLYLKKARQGRVNNWDLVDCSAPHIVGEYLADKDRSEIYKLADSGELWQERISVMSTFYFIRFLNEYDDTLKLAKQFLTHEHDLMHKAVGWMLREIGKQDKKVLLDFLNSNYLKMPRTMLRYSIEKLPEKTRQDYLKGRV